MVHHHHRAPTRATQAVAAPPPSHTFTCHPHSCDTAQTLPHQSTTLMSPRRRCTSIEEHQCTTLTSLRHRHTLHPLSHPHCAPPALGCRTIAAPICTANINHHRRSHNWGTNDH
ncbi:hypothetical protein VNO80_13277 [Phaseolus coccineus]|uniref:Uncharacterized protein n=1 Tax=Phaseolus coccineus TaxID=3886 RepID=A0AAN9N0N2_PHACN